MCQAGDGRSLPDDDQCPGRRARGRSFGRGELPGGPCFTTILHTQPNLPPFLQREQIIKAFDGIIVFTRGDQRAPHKPLLLLLALGRVQQGELRLLPYRKTDLKLQSLLRDFGTERNSTRTEYPFWRLQNDGIWEIHDANKLEKRKSNTDALKSELLRYDINGGFSLEVDDALRKDPSLIRELAQRLLNKHFPETLHDDIATAVGLDLSEGIIRRRRRDPEFRTRVLRAYGYQCAVCGFDVRIDQQSIGLEAAHVKWHQARGPDDETNGVALCTMHHKLLDFGAFSFSDDLRVLVSERANGSAGLAEWLLAFHDRPLRRPQRVEYALRTEYVSWHVREVFKGPWRALR
jgi:putative restriction endonuclease